MKFWDKISRAFVFFLGDIALSKYPMWLQYRHATHKFKGPEYQRFMKMVFNGELMPGDIFLRAFDPYLDSLLIPGNLSHLMLYYGKDPETGEEVAIHVTSDGLLKEVVTDVARTDHFCVVRPRNVPDEVRQCVADRAYTYWLEHEKDKELNKEEPKWSYDFKFKYGNDHRIFCTEFGGRCWEIAKEWFKFRFSYPSVFGFFERKSLLADDIFLSDVDIVFMTESIKKMPIWQKRQDDNLD